MSHQELPGTAAELASDGAAKAESEQETNDRRFHASVAALEDAIMDDDFRARVAAFSAKNCDSFDPAEGSGEFKLEWTELFTEYSSMMEGHLAAALEAAVDDFDMGWFMSELEARADDGAVDGEVFDVLLSLGDFEDFVSTMQSHFLEKAAASAAESGGGEELGALLSATAMAGLAPTVASFSPPQAADEAQEPSGDAHE